MKAYKVEVLIVDTDVLGAGGIKAILETTRYPNRCIYPTVMSVTEANIGEWDDEHPLNKKETVQQEYDKLFGSVNTQQL